jgi:hypothetical protein
MCHLIFFLSDVGCAENFIHLEGFASRTFGSKLTKLSLCFISGAEYNDLGLYFTKQAHCSRELSLKHTMRIKSVYICVVRHGSDPVVSPLGHSNNKAYHGSDR